MQTLRIALALTSCWMPPLAAAQAFLTDVQRAQAEALADPRPSPDQATRVPLRDLVEIRGVRDNPLVGYGLIVGLSGTGDGTQARFTIQSIANALQRMGVAVPPGAIRVRNAAAVMVTATLPAFSRPGTRIDATVASIGDAKSLTGGLLLLTPLHGPDGQVYALAQGALSLGGGFSATGGGASVTKNHTTTGTVPGGALIERAAGIDLAGRESFDLQLRRPDFATALKIEVALSAALAPAQVAAIDAGTVRLTVPPSAQQQPVGFLARALEATIQPVTPAKVVLNERTGTVVLGGDVRIGRVSITHGNLTISVVNRPEVSQPPPLSRGTTTTVPRGEVVTEEEPASGVALPEGTRVEELIGALKQLGVTPRDMIAIFEAIRAAGALHAELVVV